MSDSVRPHRRQPTRLPRPWDSPGKNTGVGCHFLLQCMKGKVKVKSLGRVRLCATPWTAAHQAPPPMGFSRREYWSGLPLPPPNVTPWTVVNQASLSMEFFRQEGWSELPFPSPGDFPNPGIEPRSPHGRQVLHQLSYEGMIFFLDFKYK